MNAKETEQPMTTLDTGIPLPPRYRGRMSKNTPYPFRIMKIDQSFLIPKKGWKKIYHQIAGYGQRNDKKFAFRTIDEETMRVWRVK